MIQYFCIQNFRSLRKTDLTLRPLTALMGMNDTGKSSLIQALLVLRQSLVSLPLSDADGKEGEEAARIRLTGSLVQLGSWREVLCQNAEAERMARMAMRLRWTDGQDLYAEFSQKSETPDSELPEGKIRYRGLPGREALFSQQFCYLSAERIGPRRAYDVRGWDIHGINCLGSKGEYAVPYLAAYGDLAVPGILHARAAKTRSLMDEASAWMAEISPHIRMNAVIQPAEQSAGLSISYAGREGRTDRIAPVNVGSGVSAVLPLIVALLRARKGDLILLENPEAHLHPRGQARMAELICRAVANGAQVLCETHSDHVVNGFRVAVKKGILRPEEAGIAFFHLNEELDTEVTEIDLDRNGNLSDYPMGLLDEWGELMAELI